MKNPSGTSTLTPLLEVARDSSTYGIARLLSMLIGIIIIPVFARIMSPEVLGKYSLALLTITVAHQAIGQWSRSSILRFDARYRDTPDYRSYMSSVFVVPVLAGLLVASILLLTHLTVGAVPLRSPDTRKVAGGVVVRPRFGWNGIGPLLQQIGWVASPQVLEMPLVPGRSSGNAT